MQLRDERVVDGVALGRPVQSDVQDRASLLEAKQVRRADGCAGSGEVREILLVHGSKHCQRLEMVRLTSILRESPYLIDT